MSNKLYPNWTLRQLKKLYEEQAMLSQRTYALIKHLEGEQSSSTPQGVMTAEQKDKLNNRLDKYFNKKKKVPAATGTHR